MHRNVIVTVYVVVLAPVTVIGNVLLLGNVIVIVRGLFSSTLFAGARAHRMQKRTTMCYLARGAL